MRRTLTHAHPFAAWRLLCYGMGLDMKIDR